jgi:hypothetical protein
VTFQAHVAAYSWPDHTPDLVLDHAGLPGFSGSPVFLANGNVVAIQVKDGRPDAPGTSGRKVDFAEGTEKAIRHV